MVHLKPAYRQISTTFKYHRIARGQGRRVNKQARKEAASHYRNRTQIDKASLETYMIFEEEIIHQGKRHCCYIELYAPLLLLIEKIAGLIRTSVCSCAMIDRIALLLSLLALRLLPACRCLLAVRIIVSPFGRKRSSTRDSIDYISKSKYHRECNLH